MTKFKVTVMRRTYYDEIAILQVPGSNAEEAAKRALNYTKKNQAEMTWTGELLTKRPRPKVVTTELVEDAADENDIPTDATDDAADESVDNDGDAGAEDSSAE